MTTDDVAALSEWLLQLGGEVEKTPVGLAVGDYELALATRERGWLVPWTDPISVIAVGVLRKMLLAERIGPALVVRDIPLAAQRLGNWLGEAYERQPFLENIVHEMRALEYTTGRPVLRAGEVPVLKDALDAATVGPMMALEAPRFYQTVGLPLSKHLAQTLTFSWASDRTGEVMPPGWRRWIVTYDWLLFRVLAHYTHDPILTRWFEEERNPLQELGKRLELTPEQTVAFILWLCCGEDEALLSEQHPTWATKLPQAPQLVKAAKADKHIPTLRLGLVRLWEQLSSTRRAQTLYGRLSPWGLTPQQLLHFQIMGSVNDLLDVALVTFINAGSQVHWLVSEGENTYARWLRAQIIGYTERIPMEWEEELQQLAPLGNPVSVGLQPKVLVE